MALQNCLALDKLLVKEQCVCGVLNNRAGECCVTGMEEACPPEDVRNHIQTRRPVPVSVTRWMENGLEPCLTDLDSAQKAQTSGMVELDSGSSGNAFFNINRPSYQLSYNKVPDWPLILSSLSLTTVCSNHHYWRGPWSVWAMSSAGDGLKWLHWGLRWPLPQKPDGTWGGAWCHSFWFALKGMEKYWCLSHSQSRGQETGALTDLQESSFYAAYPCWQITRWIQDWRPLSLSLLFSVSSFSISSFLRSAK